MTRLEFRELLLKATADVIALTREYVWNTIPDRVQYRVFQNQSYDRHPDGRILTDYPDDSVPVEGFHLFTDPDDVVNYLWRDKGVPQWINVNIAEVTPDLTSVDLVCCGRYTAEEESLYYTTWGMGPFGVKGPWYPPGWRSGQQNEKFDLHWPRDSRKNGD